MRRSLLPLIVTSVVLASSAAWTFFQGNDPGVGMTSAAEKLIASFNDEQQQTALLPYDTPKRVDWHFIPKDHRKGLQIKHMNSEQRELAHDLLKAALSQMGYDKTTTIMELEKLLHELEGGKGSNIRDPERYYFTFFGKPSTNGRWGLSVEGHHLSLNFVVENGQVISSTPQFFAANPATVKNENKTGIEVGTRVLKVEEKVAFDLVNSLDGEQQASAIIEDKAPREIRDAGSAQPPTAPAAGLSAYKMTDAQQKMLRQIIREYAAAMPKKVAEARLEAIREAGFRNVHFAWAGATEPGVGHYYRIQGPTFLIEFVNTQPDAAGNPANHIHCVWRDMNGDFAIPIDG
ncbi:hypothetical protein Mal4_34890 [Maioricimonas rarisocia]|uniref:DUF3500 domain-containing protein n=1 Tax=Maioricimonas rarisocia TaxID=2528026 RepID=A0A517Z9K9_9PLAN|nr:DUF3500 domain-containing protein [Maioricimonas rarisocia]QDU39153.1 hypothetical protein Mal4_34890 [Maioricimonas rarisocia]